MKYVTFILTLLVAGAILLAAEHFLGRAKASRLAPMMPAEVPVVTAATGTRAFANRIEAIGTAAANESVDITATVAERIAGIGFTEGATVAAEDLLVQLEDAEERAAVEEAAIHHAEEQREFERVRALHDKKMAAAQELDSRRSAMDTAAARLAAARARLQDRAIRAPFAGVLGLRRVSPGAFVSPGTVITTLDDTRLIRARFAMPETVLTGIRTGQTLVAGSVALPGMAFTGTVSSVDSRIDPVTRAVTVEARIPNSGQTLRPGMLLTVSLISRPRTSIGIPEKALLAYADRQYVFVVQADGTAGRREVQLGERDVGWVEVTAGLREGETIVVEGQMDLKDGMRVRPAGTPPATAPGATPAGQ